MCWNCYLCSCNLPWGNANIIVSCWTPALPIDSDHKSCVRLRSQQMFCLFFSKAANRFESAFRFVKHPQKRHSCLTAGTACAFRGPASTELSRFWCVCRWELCILMARAKLRQPRGFGRESVIQSTPWELGKCVLQKSSCCNPFLPHYCFNQ